jgi:DNA-directed RNA polymerase sigma subunit (sigma70/sigma32)
MTSFIWPNDEGWPYPDGEGESPRLADDLDLDDDVLTLRSPTSHVFDTLDPLERQVIQSRYGLAGQPPRSMKQLGAELGMDRADLREVLGSGLHKLRTQLR